MNGSRLIVGCGPRQVEDLLLEEVARRRPRGLEDLKAPLRLVVPSEALRRHLCRRLVGRFGSLVGVQVQTLLGVAREILERAGRSLRTHEAAVELMVRRLAARHPLLGPGFAELEDGYGAVVGAVRDLLDAGLEAEHAEALLEKIGELSETADLGERLQRAQAVVELAAAVGEWCRAVGAQRVSGLQEAARYELEERGAAVLPARGVLVHGFADFTALAGDLASALLSSYGGAVLLDRPADPAHPERSDPGVSFLDRIELRFAGLRRDSDNTTEPGSDAAIRISEADDEEGQAAQVAATIRALLDDGLRPEEVGVVARDLEPFLGPLCRHFEAFGVPFSTVGATLDGAGQERRTRALLALLEEGERTPLEVWGTLRRPALAEPVRLSLALRTLGVRRLADMVGVEKELGHRDLVVPVATAGEGPAGDELQISAGLLVSEAERARAVCAVLGQWPQTCSAGDHAEHLLQVAEMVHLSEQDTDRLAGVLAELTGELAPVPELERERWLRLLRLALEDAVRCRPGGAGAGVQLCSVMEARGLSFERLFVLGVERGLFPRQVVEDPLLPDTVRGRLVELLPQLPVKSRGWVEDSYLFAQLTAAAPVVECLWGRRRAGSETTASPFLDRLESVADRAAEMDRPIERGTALSGALAQALSEAEVARLADWWAAALREGRERAGWTGARVPAPRLAAARVQLVRVVEGARGLAPPSPFWGLVGGCEWPRGVGLSLLETMGRCPWQALVTRVLKVDQVHDPRFEFPGFDARLRGEMVHRVLQDIVNLSLEEPPQSLARATTAAAPRAVFWPDESRLELMIEEGVAAVLRRHRVLGSVPLALLVAMLRPHLKIAQRLEWPAGRALPVLGAELEGEVELEQATLRFRVDRADEVAGALRFVDYKTGRPLSPDKKPATRLKHLRQGIAEGVNLQLPAYLHASATRSSSARYVYLSPNFAETEPEQRLLELAADDLDSEAAFAAAVECLLEARRRGVWIPRPESGGKRKTPASCERACSVREACIRDDTDQRRRLLEWLHEQSEEGEQLGAVAARLWRLGGSE